MVNSSLPRCGARLGPCFFAIRHGLAAVLAIASLGCLPAHAQPPLPTIALQVGKHTIQAEYANTPETLREGLMYRSSLADNSGMLFELGEPDIHCFWMKNTLIPLSIAFIDDQGRIVDIQDMEPQSLAPHCPTAPVTQALEMDQGWFLRAQVRPGDQVRR